MKTMPHAKLAPPPAPPRPPESTGAAPHVPVRPPFSRGERKHGLRISRRGLALSTAAHLLLGVAVWLAPVPQRSPRGDSRVEGARAPVGEVSYVDIGAWPGGADGGARAEPSARAEETSQQREVRADSAPASAPAREPAERFPRREPAGIPRAVPGAARAGGAPAGVAQGGVSVGGGAPGVATNGAGGTGRARSGPAGGRLGTELGDGRLIVPPAAAPERVLTDRERLNARIAERLRRMNDSTAEEAGRARRARNWTVRDRSGREWGIGEGGVPVVAGRRIEQVRVRPPIATDRDSELHDSEVARQRGEIDRQVSDEDRDRNLRERTRATRERADRERAERQRQGAPGKP